MGLFSRVARRGELLPILWNVDWGLDLLPNQAVIPDQLFVTLARVRLRDGRLSIDRVTQNEIDQKSGSFEDLLAKAHANQRKGLRVDQTDTGEGELLVLHRNSTPVSGALTLPDFHAQMSQALSAESLVVAIPNPEEVAVAAEGSQAGGDDPVRVPTHGRARPDASATRTRWDHRDRDGRGWPFGLVETP